MIDEVFRKNKTTQKIADAEERFLKISPMPDGSKVVDTRSSRLTYVADPVDDKDAINKSWATKYFKDEKDAITKLGESATAKSAEIDTKLVKFNSDKASIEQTDEELKALSAETKSKAEETKAQLESVLAQLEQAKTKIDNFNADYAKAKELKGDIEGKAVEVKANLESVKVVLVDVTAKSTDILLTYNNAKQDLTNLGNATKQEIAVAKTSIDTKANEALSQASTSLADIKAIVADFKGKQMELNALKASLETLKSSLESLNKAGLINDTEAGVAQTYSSNKINNLMQGVLRESDAAEGNVGGKLVRRNAQGNIYATNIFLNAPTKAEVSDIKSALATDKWRFIVKDTGEGQLRSMSIKDFINSQEVDAYGKTESDNRYLAKSEASTDSASNTIVKRDVDGNISTNNIKISDAGSNVEMETDIEGDTQSTYQLLVRKSKDEPIKLMNLQGFISRLTSSTQASIDSTKASISQLFLKKTEAETTYLSKEDAKRALEELEHTSAKNEPNGYAGLNASAEIDKEALPISVKELLSASKSFISLDGTGRVSLNYIPYTEALKKVEGSAIDLITSKNFCIEFSTGVFSFTNMQRAIGQSGVIVVKEATNIKGWASGIVWGEIPTDLKNTEVFAYFVISEDEIYMGRA